MMVLKEWLFLSKLAGLLGASLGTIFVSPDAAVAHQAQKNRQACAWRFLYI
jgi:hypothetical protein